MPEIGRPLQNSSFSQIAMDNRSGDNDKKNLNKDLNKIAGIKEENKFVDRQAHNKLGKDGFLKLLAHQLKNQDPLKPMDQKQFAADLAQFSQLEQLTNVNAKLENMAKNDMPESKFFGASFLGKEVLTKGTSFKYEGTGESQDIPFYLEKPAKKVVVRVYDSNKQLMARVESEGLGRGQQSLTWDGNQLDGVVAAKDTYRVEVQAFDEDYKPFKGETKAKGVVTSVDFEGQETILTLKDGQKVFLRDVDHFALPSTQEKFTSGQNAANLRKSALAAYNDIENTP